MTGGPAKAILRRRKMATPRLLLPVSAVALLIAAGATLVGASQRAAFEGSQAPSAASSPAATMPIKHVVIIIKENHSFDNLFGRMPGVDGTTHARVGKKRVSMNETPDALSRDIKHSGSNALRAVDHGKMDGFAKQSGAIQGGRDVADSQYAPSQIPDYYKYAQTYSIADRFFSTILGASFPNHIVLIAGNSAKAIDNVNRHGHAPDAWGCDSSPKATVASFSGGRLGNEKPCFNIQTLADEANDAHVSWKYYSAPLGNGGYIWSSFDAIKHIRYSKQWTTNVVNTGDFISDVQHGRLPQIELGDAVPGRQ